MKYLFLLLLLGNAMAADLTVVVDNIKSNRGTIKVALFPPNGGFPSEYQNAVDTAILDIRNKKARVTFKNLRPDTYAVAIFHDENSNDDLDLSNIGIPAEPFGFSNNPRMLGPPTWRKCKFSLRSNKTINVRLRTLFSSN
jgi:uncharacterized protein (DUF2141 family)